jgi:hypothetical protein
VCKFSNASATVCQNERRETWPYLKYCDKSLVCGKYNNIIVRDVFRILTPVAVVTRVPSGRFWVRSPVRLRIFLYREANRHVPFPSQPLNDYWEFPTFKVKPSGMTLITHLLILSMQIVEVSSASPCDHGKVLSLLTCGFPAYTSPWSCKTKLLRISYPLDVFVFILWHSEHGGESERTCTGSAHARGYASAIEAPKNPYICQYKCYHIINTGLQFIVTEGDKKRLACPVHKNISINRYF